jgi:hypothetical protein
MKQRIENMNRFRPKVFIAALFLFLLAVSCHNKVKTEAEHRNIIPEKEFISILTDFYLADGLFSLPEIRLRFSSRDSVLNYIDIIESHGYTYDAMNSTIKYYFIRKPKKLIKIYDNVLGKLSEMDSRYEKESVNAELASKNHWKEKPEYAFPDTSLSSGTDFSLSLYTLNTFTLEFTVTVFPDDQTINPCFSAWYCNADSSETGRRSWLPAIKYIKDGQPHTYSITEDTNFKGSLVLKGLLLDSENNPPACSIHATISKITFTFLKPVV